MGRGRKRGCEKIVLSVHLPENMGDATCLQEIYARFYEEQLWKHISAYAPKVQLAMLEEIKQNLAGNHG